MFHLFKTKKEPGAAPFDRRDTLALVAGVIIFVVISLPIIGASSVWFDEAFGAYLLRFNFADIARYTASDVHPPLYYWALKAWGMVFGDGQVALRSLSVVFGAIAIIFAFLLVRKYFGRRSAWIGLLFMAVTPFFIRYAIEMRMYTMVAAIAFAATYVLAIAEERKKTKLWILYGALVGIGMLTHYFIALVWVTHWLWRFMTRRSDSLRGKALARNFFSSGWITAHIVALVVFAPWIGYFVYQLFNVQANGFWIGQVTPATPVNFLTTVLLYLQVGSTKSWVAVLFVATLVTFTILIVKVYQRTLSPVQKQAFLLLGLLAAVPPLALIAVSLPPLRPAFVDRYVLVSAITIGLIIGISLGQSYQFLKRRTWWTLSVATLGVFVYGVGNVYWLGNYNTTTNTSNNTQQLLAQIAKQTPASEPIIADSPWLYYEAAFYSTSTHPVYFIDANVQYRYGSLLMLKENDLGKIKDLADFESQNQTFWYIGRPGASDETPPSANLIVISSFRISDSITGKAAYQAVQYGVRTSGE